MTKSHKLGGPALAPYSVWALLFILVPLIFVAYYAFTDNAFAFNCAACPSATNSSDASPGDAMPLLFIVPANGMSKKVYSLFQTETVADALSRLN